MKIKKILGAILVILLVGAMLPGLAMGVSWQDPAIRTITKLNWLDMVSNQTLQGVFINQNASRILKEADDHITLNLTGTTALFTGPGDPAPGLGLTDDYWLDTLTGSLYNKTIAGWTLQYTVPTGVTLGAVGQQQNPLDLSNQSAARSGAILESVNQANTNITEAMPLAGNTTFPATSNPGGILTFLDTLGHSVQDSLWTIAGLLLEVDNRNVANNTHWFNEGILAHLFNDTSLENRIYFSTWKNGTFFGNWSFLAPWTLEMETQQAANDTLTKGASVKLCTDRLEENQTFIKGAAVRVCDDHIGTNVTTTATISPMAYQFVVPASGGAVYSAPIEGASGNIWIPIDFDGTASEAAIVDVPLPGDYSAGFTETYSWTATSAGGGGVVWGTELACIGDNVALDASWGTQVLVTDTFQTSGALHISGASASTTPSGSCAAGRTLAVRVKRMPAEAGDTMSDDARFLGLQLTYTKAGA
jgi:hypothetical protein